MQQLHHDEVRITPDLAKRLLADQHPGLAHLPVRLLADQGTDNVVMRLGEEVALRFPRKPSAVPSLLVEREWLPRLAPHLPVSVPVPVAHGEPTDAYPFPWSVCTWVPGSTSDRSEDVDPADMALRLGHVVRALQAIDTTGAPRANERTQRAGSLAQYDEVTREALGQVTALVDAGHLEADLFDPAAARDLWEAAVGAPAWSGQPVWVHRDLYLGNLLVRDGRLTGVIDFGGLVAGDPAGDVMAAWHVLPPTHRSRFLDHVEADAATRLRARGWVLSQGLLALPYYLDSHGGMVRMARRAIAAALDTPLA